MPNTLPSLEPGPTLSVVSELLILSDGRVLGHNLTPEFTALLAALSPADPHLSARREASAACPQHEPSTNSATL